MRFEENPSLEFEHYLAEKLGMLVADIRERMGGAEFTRWYVYFGRKAQQQQIAMARAKLR